MLSSTLKRLLNRKNTTPSELLGQGSCEHQYSFNYVARVKRVSLISLLKKALIASGASLLFSGAVLADSNKVGVDNTASTPIKTLKQSEQNLYYRLNNGGNGEKENNGTSEHIKLENIEYADTNGGFTPTESFSKTLNNIKCNSQRMFKDSIEEAQQKNIINLQYLAHSDLSNNPDYLIATTNPDVLKIAQYYATLATNNLLRKVIDHQDNALLQSATDDSNIHISMKSEINRIMQTSRFQYNLKQLIANPASFREIEALGANSPTAEKAILVTLLEERINQRISLDEK